jgi:hypothetical protein
MKDGGQTGQDLGWVNAGVARLRTAPAGRRDKKVQREVIEVMVQEFGMPRLLMHRTIGHSDWQNQGVAEAFHGVHPPEACGPEPLDTTPRTARSQTDGHGNA